MSKDLKNEYEALLDSEIPDLWSRIEPELHEKQICKKENENNPKKKRSGTRIYFYSGIAAACLCLAIAVPVIIRYADGGSKSETAFDTAESNSAIAMEEAAQGNEMFEDSAADFEAEEATDDCVTETVQAPDDVAEDKTAGAAEADKADRNETTDSKADILEIRGRVLDVSTGEDVQRGAYIVYEIGLRMEDMDVPEELGGEDTIRVIQYADTEDEEIRQLEEGHTVTTMIQYDPQVQAYILVQTE